jgi:hypothetical protein
MDSFQTIVVSIACLLLILILTYFGIKMSSGGSGKRVMEFPLKHNLCPDRWTVIDSKCIVPQSAEPNFKAFENIENFPYGDVGECIGGESGTNTYKNCETTVAGDIAYNKIISFDPNHVDWTSGGKTALCAKHQWANENGINWDGVSNYTKC